MHDDSLRFGAAYALSDATRNHFFWLPSCAGQPYWQAAGVADRIDLRIAPATETLNALLEVDALL